MLQLPERSCWKILKTSIMVENTTAATKLIYQLVSVSQADGWFFYDLSESEHFIVSSRGKGETRHFLL